MTIRKSLAVFSCFLLLGGGAPGLFAQTTTGTIAGVIVDPSGGPAAGFRVLLRDTASDTHFTSAPTDPAGNYTIQVPVGGRYKLEGVMAPDGLTRLPVQDIAPVSVLEPGTTRLNVRFTSDGKSAGEQKEKKKGGVPWYQRPGPIVGMILGAGALAAIALGGGGSDASPSTTDK